MSDALTDIQRDIEIKEAWNKLEKLEKSFFIQPSLILSEKITLAWREYLKMSPGYWGTPFKYIPKNRIFLHLRYQKTGAVVPLMPYIDEWIYGRWARKGHGLWMEPNLGELFHEIVRMVFSEKIYPDIIKIRLKKGKERQVILEFGEVSCDSCIYSGLACYLEQKIPTCRQYEKVAYQKKMEELSE